MRTLASPICFCTGAIWRGNRSRFLRRTTVGGTATASPAVSPVKTSTGDSPASVLIMCPCICLTPFDATTLANIRSVRRALFGRTGGIAGFLKPRTVKGGPRVDNEPSRAPGGSRMLWLAHCQTDRSIEHDQVAQMKRESEARPVRLADQRGPYLLGRSAELDELEHFARAPAAGGGNFLAIVGEPGVGKTSLLESAVGAAVDLRLLRARGVEAEIGLPFACLHQLLQPILQLRRGLPLRQREALAVALGLDEGGQPDPFVLGLAALGLLSLAAQEHHVLCVVDDFHWVDAASRAVLLFVARRIDGIRVSMLLTVRRDEWMVLGDSQLPTTDLRGLDLAAASDLITREHGLGVLPTVAQRLHEATGGNPLALIEMVRLLSDDQLRGWKPLPTPLPLTSGVEDAFAARMEGLGSDTRALLLTIAADGSGKLRTILRAAE